MVYVCFLQHAQTIEELLSHIHMLQILQKAFGFLLNASVQKPIKIDAVDPLELENHSLTLAEVIDITLTNNPTTQESWYNARAAAAEYGKALSKYYVLADLNSFYENKREALFARRSKVIAQEVFYGANLAATYTILDFGKRKASSSAAREALYNADFMHNQACATSGPYNYGHVLLFFVAKSSSKSSRTRCL